MSMIARFVQIQPGLLQDLLEDPSSVESLFEDEPLERSAARLQAAERMRSLLATRGASMLAGGLPGLDPKTREALTQRLEQLGVSMDALKSGKGGEALADLVMSRMGMAGKGAGAGAGRAAAAGRGAAISLDKAWHGVHYLLCGSAVPDSTALGQAVMGGTEIGDDFSGYGEARYFAAERVAEIARELGRAALEGEMRTRFVPARMESAGIYPGGWSTEPPDWLFDAYRELRDFYSAASAGGFAVLTCLV